MSWPAARHLYVHVPFCARRCSYCDFPIAVRRVVPVDEYLAAVAGELQQRFDVPSQPHGIDTLYLGGGTPSRLGVDGVTRLLALLRRWVHWAPDAEVTLEVNPEDVTVHAAAGWRAAGVTRLSLGAQSFEPQVLSWMHRGHEPAQIEQAIDILGAAGFASWSFDLIFAVPTALGRDWERDLDRALRTAPPHLSLYGLTVEPGTPLARWAERGTARPVDEDRYAEEFRQAHQALTAAGLEHYEVSNFARPGHRARHNSAYWRGVPYVGVGPGAHGFDGRQRRWNIAAYAAWVAAVAAGHDPMAGTEAIGAAEAATEAVYLGLRTVDGLRLEAGEDALVAPWAEAGWVTLEEGRLRCTAEGWLRLDSLAATLTRARDAR